MKSIGEWGGGSLHQSQQLKWGLSDETTKKGTEVGRDIFLKKYNELKTTMEKTKKSPGLINC
jgi:hypothetical protein